MSTTFKKGLTIFLTVSIATILLSGCKTQNAEPLPGQPDGQQQGMELQEFRDGNAMDMTTLDGQNNNALNMTTKDGIDGNALNTTPNTENLVNPLNRNSDKGIGGVMDSMNADTQKAKNIKAQLTNMNEVKDANVIVMGNTALVGCKLSDNAENKEDVKNKIMQKVKSADKSITNCTVSEMPEIMDRISKLSKDIMNSKPANEVNDEFNKIMQQIKPKL